MGDEEGKEGAEPKTFLPGPWNSMPPMTMGPWGSMPFGKGWKGDPWKGGWKGDPFGKGWKGEEEKEDKDDNDKEDGDDEAEKKEGGDEQAEGMAPGTFKGFDPFKGGWNSMGFKGDPY